eukprot:6288434-Prymnesium_polylepis.3
MTLLKDAPRHTVFTLHTISTQSLSLSATSTSPLGVTVSPSQPHWPRCGACSPLPIRSTPRSHRCSDTMITFVTWDNSVLSTGDCGDSRKHDKHIAPVSATNRTAHGSPAASTPDDATARLLGRSRLPFTPLLAS